jgi:hypothetical protein
MKSQLDRNVRRFDVKLRDLVNSEQMPPDPTLPSLLQPEAGSIVTTNAPSAAAAINSAQSGGAPNVANAAIARLHATNQRTSSPLNVQNALLNQAHLNSPSARSQRETSADASKRRRLNTSLSGTVPTTASSLRQSSLGPSSGTPKAGTPNPASSRAGSAQPNKKAPHNKRIAPHQASSSHRKRIRSGNAALKKGDRKRHLTSPTPSPSAQTEPKTHAPACEAHAPPQQHPITQPHQQNQMQKAKKTIHKSIACVSVCRLAIWLLAITTIARISGSIGVVWISRLNPRGSGCVRIVGICRGVGLSRLLINECFSTSTPGKFR